MIRQTSTTSVSRALLVGAGSGVIAAVAMAMYAMVAAWVKGDGFFTPMYHIASLWASPDSMMGSMQEAMGGSDFNFVAGPAILGALIHMMTGAAYGAMFGLIASRLRLAVAPLAAIGLVYGFLVFVVSAYVGLPIAAGIFDSGDQITHMAKLAGWGTFIVEHLLYGLVLGLLVAFGRDRSARAMPANAGAH